MIVLVILCWIFSSVLIVRLDRLVRDLIRAETTEWKTRCIDSITVCYVIICDNSFSDYDCGVLEIISQDVSQNAIRSDFMNVPVFICGAVIISCLIIGDALAESLIKEESVEKKIRYKDDIFGLIFLCFMSILIMLMYLK